MADWGMQVPGDETPAGVVSLLMPTRAGHQIRHAKRETDLKVPLYLSPPFF